MKKKLKKSYGRWAVIAAALLVLVALVAYAATHKPAPPSAMTTDKLQVAASFYPMAEFARQVGGDKVEVTTIVPAGTEPHDYEPTPQALASIDRAAVFVYNGAGFELWADKLHPDEDDVFVKASDGTDLAQTDGNTDNPHVWLDPVQAQTEVKNILKAFQKADPKNAAYYANNTDNYLHKLKDLDKSYQDGLEQCSNRFVIVSHDTMVYLANRYGFNAQAIAGLSPEDEPSPQKLAELTQYAKDHNVKYVFYEDLVGPKLSETLANEAGIKTLVFSPLEGLTKEDVAEGKNYLSVQEQNLRNLRTAMACK